MKTKDTSVNHAPIASILGRKAWIVRPTVKKITPVAKPRIHVEGLVKKDGTFIRFKSVKKAETHIRNMGLEKDDGR